MKNFLVEESERIEILNRHKLMVEQQMPESYKKLEAGRDAGCFGKRDESDRYWGLTNKTQGGNWVFQKTTSNQALKQQGLFLLRIRPDGMYYNTDGKQKFTNPQPLPKPCPAMTDYGKKSESDINNEYLIAQYKKDGWSTPEELRAKNVDTRELSNTTIWQSVPVGNVKLYKKVGTATGTMDEKEEVRNQWVLKLRKDGYIVNPTDTEKDNYQYVELSKINYSGLPPGLFSPTQLVYLDPSITDPSILKDKQEGESMKRKECKETIERFYNEFIRTKGRQVTNRGLVQRMKDQSQFCKNEFEGKWGIGGGKFDDMILILSGRKRGGPSSSGDDSIFRLQ